MGKEVTIQLKRARKEVWERENPVLAHGEPGYSDGVLKIGDGKTHWNDLPAISNQLLNPNTKLTKEQKAKIRELIDAAYGPGESLILGSNLNETEIMISTELPDRNESGYITAGYVTFYTTDDDQPVRLGHIAPGVRDDDAVTFSQLKEATKNIIGNIVATDDGTGIITLGFTNSLPSSEEVEF